MDTAQIWIKSGRVCVGAPSDHRLNHYGPRVIGVDRTLENLDDGLTDRFEIRVLVPDECDHLVRIWHTVIFTPPPTKIFNSIQQQQEIK